ncbi:MAG: hypothetical protein HRT71_03395 [Flavobacteriales bacterium]|nr:hypothetical protein [Flavobacteriales bacterium]
MRKLVTSLALILLVSSAYSQQVQWADIGIKAGYGYNLLFNANVFDDKNLNYETSWGFSYGGKLGWNFNYNNELVAEFMITKFTQDFTYDNTDTSSIGFGSGGHNITLKTFDFPILWRNNSDKTGGYVELGPQISLVKSALNSGLEEMDIEDDIAYTYFSVVAGFGNYLMGSDNTGLVIGIRLMYSLQDVITGAGAKNGQPFTPYPTDFANEKTTNPFQALLVLELNHDFGYLVSASCQQRNKLILFGL